MNINWEKCSDRAGPIAAVVVIGLVSAWGIKSGLNIISSEAASAERTKTALEAIPVQGSQRTFGK